MKNKLYKEQEAIEKIRAGKPRKQYYQFWKFLKMNQNKILQNPRVIIIQKLYGHHLNKDSTITFPKHRYKKFIKDVVNGTIERKEYINEIISSELKDEIRILRDLTLKIIIESSIYEIVFRPDTPSKIIINEYLNVANVLIDDGKKRFLNAVLDKLSKKLRQEKNERV